jgi:alpha-glucosidase (family GH31 glycosyl hydrolase)
LERYRAFARAVGFDTSRNATIPCDMSNRSWAAALFGVYYDAAPLGAVDWWWTDYPAGCTNSSARGQPDPLLWSNLVYAEARALRGARRPMAFSRYGGPGAHRYPIGFSGDTFQHELTLDFEVRMTPTAANALFGWWSHDIGGFHADRTTVTGGACPGDSNPSNASGAELFSRWLQFGALSPILRTHCGGCGPEGPPNCSCDRRIWRFPTHFPFMRDALRLRAALVPYLATAARAFHDTAIAPLRALYVEAPADDRSYAFPKQYHFGADLLAAPITGASPGGVGAVEAAVFLPAGSAWAPWGGGAALAGGAIDTRPYGQGEIPLFARADALLPLALNGGADIAATSPAIAWTLWAAGFAPPAELRGRTSLYEDDGATVAYKGGVALRTNATFAWAPGGGGRFTLTVAVAAAAGGYEGQPAARAHAVRVRGWAQRGLAGTAVVANGAPLPQGAATPGWGLISVPAGAPQLLLPDGTLEVRLGELPLAQPLVVEVSGSAAL